MNPSEPETKIVYRDISVAPENWSGKRSKGSVLVVTDGRWDGADVRIDSRVLGYGGLGAGRGRVTTLDVEVEVSGRGFRPRVGRMELGAQSGSTAHTQWRMLPTARHLLSEAL